MDCTWVGVLPCGWFPFHITQSRSHTVCSSVVPRAGGSVLGPRGVTE